MTVELAAQPFILLLRGSVLNCRVLIRLGSFFQSVVICHWHDGHRGNCLHTLLGRPLCAGGECGDWNWGRRQDGACWCVAVMRVPIGRVNHGVISWLIAGRGVFWFSTDERFNKVMPLVIFHEQPNGGAALEVKPRRNRIDIIHRF